MKTYAVTLIKTEHYSTVVKIEAESEDEAIALAESDALDYGPEEVTWHYSDCEVEGIQVEEVE